MAKLEEWDAAVVADVAAAHDNADDDKQSADGCGAAAAVGHMKGSCGFEVELCLDVFSLPPRIGKHGAHGCRAARGPCARMDNQVDVLM